MTDTPRDMLAVTGESPVSTRDDRVPRSVYRAPDGATCLDLHPRELVKLVASGEGTLWVDVDSTNRAQHALLE